MNVIFIYPEFPDTFWSFKHALKFTRKKAASPPLGLLTVAAMLPEEWGKRLVDTNVTKLRDSDLLWADTVFISGMAVQKSSARNIIKRCQDFGLKIVAGGPLFTSEHDQFEGVDHFVLNEAELTLPPFLADLENGSEKRYYKSSEYADMHESPVPLWELADLKGYASLSVQYSRGCPFKCEFCDITALLGHRPRLKTSDQVLAELNAVHDLGWRGAVFFVDDNFIGNKKCLKDDLLPALIDWRKDKKGFSFYTEATINLADHEGLMNLMTRAGFDMVFIGIETPDESSLAECSKVQNKGRDLVQNVKRLQRAGLQVLGGFIVGFDNDKPNIFERQIEFIQKSGIVAAMVGILQAPRGTKLYERMKAEGRLLGSMSGDNVDGSTNIIPTMSLETLREGYEKILQHIYSPENYYQRVKTFLREYEAPKIKTPLTRQDVLAFFRSMYRLGILGRERVHYWKLLIWTRIRRPELFPLAVTLAIYGYHFRKTCELQIS